MPSPTLDDDGESVTLDLHGATVHEALVLTRDVLRVADRRGRAEVTLVHGHSTSDVQGHSRTIKNELRRLVERGDFDHVVRGVRRDRGRLVLKLNLTGRSNPKRLQLQDL